MKEFPPNINPEVFTIIGIIVGLIIEDDYTSDELNSIGNWLILVGQITLTTAAQQQMINNRYQGNSGSRIKSNANDHSVMNEPLLKRSDVNLIYRNVIDELNELKNEIEELKKTSLI